MQRPPCSCVGAGQVDGLGLLQKRRPRECTCINGMTTYAITARDELETMGEVDLRAYLLKCEHGREDLDRQNEYQTSAVRAQVDGVERNLMDLERLFASQQNSTARKVATVAAEKRHLKEETDALQKERNQLDVDYSKAYTRWYKLTAELSQKMERLHSCHCKAAPSAASTSATLLARRLHLARGLMIPDKTMMYDLVAKVEACEAASVALSDSIDEKLAEARKQTLKASEDMDAVRRRVAEGQRLAGILDQGPLVAELKGVRDVLKKSVETRQKQVDNLAQRSGDLERRGAELGRELLGCGC